MSNFKLGQKAKDIVTGFSGTITGHARYLTGCDQYCILPSCGKDKTKYAEAQWFDENRIVVTSKSVLKLNNLKVNGCDQTAPKK